LSARGRDYVKSEYPPGAGGAIYEEDAACVVRKSHETPALLKLYSASEFLTDGPCSHLSHKLQHTHYAALRKCIG
jgi:NADH-quinone oxidoreductase subunit G/[NiFe] hydrogenase diaphorase moiety small subunit